MTHLVSHRAGESHRPIRAALHAASTALQTRAGFGFRRGRHISKATSIQLKAMSGIRVMVRKQRVARVITIDDVEDDQAKAFGTPSSVDSVRSCPRFAR